VVLNDNQDLRLLGQTLCGVYDAVDSADPDLLHHYYGAAENQEHHPTDDTEAESLPSNSASGSESLSNSSFDSPSNSGSGSTSPSNSDSDPESLSNSTSGSEASSNFDLESPSDSSSNLEPPSSGLSFDPETDSEDDTDSDGDDGSNAGNGSVAQMDGPEVRSAGVCMDIAQIIAAAQGRNIRHDAAEVAQSNMPFINADEGRAFAIALDNTLLSEEYPTGFHLNDEYESSESYRTGRSSRPLVIPLPHDVWFPRILVWCRALDLLMRLELAREQVV